MHGARRDFLDSPRLSSVKSLLPKAAGHFLKKALVFFPASGAQKRGGMPSLRFQQSDAFSSFSFLQAARRGGRSSGFPRASCGVKEGRSFLLKFRAAQTELGGTGP
jgi:hypothetical protein